MKVPMQEPKVTFATITLCKSFSSTLPYMFSGSVKNKTRVLTNG